LAAPSLPDVERISDAFRPSDLDELPSLKEFEQLARAPSAPTKASHPASPTQKLWRNFSGNTRHINPSNEGDEPAPLTPLDSPNSADVESEQKAENARAESASSK